MKILLDTESGKMLKPCQVTPTAEKSRYQIPLGTQQIKTIWENEVLLKEDRSNYVGNVDQVLSQLRLDHSSREKEAQLPH